MGGKGTGQRAGSERVRVKGNNKDEREREGKRKEKCERWTATDSKE